MGDFDFDEPEERRQVRKPRGAPLSRVYLHKACGGQTRVSEGDYTHICDPFRPCTSTYCCGCETFVPLGQVYWDDTGESIAAYRRRLRSESPGLLKLWRYGLGLLLGAAFGGTLGMLIAVLAEKRGKTITSFSVGGAMIGGIVIYLLGTFILNRAYNIDYRTME